MPHLLSAVPISNASVVAGIVFFKIVVPNTLMSWPTKIFFVTAIPPAVLIEPLFRLVLSAVLATIIDPERVILPSTSRASLGTNLLMPTLSSKILSTVVGVPSLLICKSIELPIAEL